MSDAERKILELLNQKTGETLELNHYEVPSGPEQHHKYPDNHIRYPTYGKEPEDKYKKSAIEALKT